jgi:hypothetical protein
VGKAWPPTQATWSTFRALDTTSSPLYSLWASFLTSRGFTCYIWILKHSCLLFPKYSHHLFVTSQSWEYNTGSTIQPSEAQIQWWEACRLLGAWGPLGTKFRASDTRLRGEISITLDMQMTPPLWQKVKRNWKASSWRWKRRLEKWLKTQHSIN